jgi:CHAT domain-containing protein
VGEAAGRPHGESLVRAFLDAGSRYVVATRWSVDSAATAALMDSFYRTLGSDGDVGTALSSAAAAVAENSKWAHPFYWAAFQVFAQ